jgi:hypothetical protein
MAHEHGPTVARAGWVAKGLVYATVGVLTLQLALGDPSGAPDQEGALRALADQPFGTALLVFLVVGLAAYAIGRLLEATWLADDDTSALDRARAIGSGLTYGLLAVGAVRLLTSSGSGSGGGGGGGRGGRGSGGGSDARSLTAGVLDWSLGPWLVGGVGVAFLAAAAYEAWRGHTGEFMEELDTGSMDHRVRKNTERLGRVGLFARGMAMALVGWFLIRAAVQHDPSEAKGLDQALRSLADEGWGTVILLAVAIGFVGYGAYCAVQARYRKVGGS